MSTPTVINEEYDIVIAGGELSSTFKYSQLSETLDYGVIGGTTACVIASRLATTDANLRVLLLEAGPTTYHDPAHTVPANFWNNLAPGSRTVRWHVSQPSAALGGRRTMVPCGQCFGGGGSINMMLYTRPSASDYDDWETVYQNTGWGSKDLIPFLRKIETYHVPGGGPTHGTDGPLAVSQGGFASDLAEQFLQVARTLDPGLAHKPEDADTNDLETINVCTAQNQMAVEMAQMDNAETGTRSDVPHNMIYPLKDTRPNLHFLTGVHVKHVMFDDENRATGLAYSLNPLFHPDGPRDTRTVRGTKLVLISAGAFGSPGILERSESAPRTCLNVSGLSSGLTYPGLARTSKVFPVQRPSRRPQSLTFKYFAADEAQSLDAIFRNEEGAIDATAAELGKTKKEILMQISLDAGIKWRPKPSEVAELGPEFQDYWDSYFVNASDKPVLWFGLGSAFLGSPLVPPRKYYTFIIYTEYPLARGHAHITCSDDVSVPLDFVPGLLESKADMQPLKWGYKFAREIARRMPHFRGEPLAHHPAFAPGGPASVVAHAEGPVPFDTPRIVYSDDDERVLEEFTRANVSPWAHSLGTCAMKPRERGGVVDSNLNVYGVRGLKVADLSIAPSNVSANTYGTALVIGEKAAVIIAEELGINRSSSLPRL
ncbi:alcohol oxidase [Lactarius quietus]|nr:alcohol oxidase [Lactarius quietus]